MKKNNNLPTSKRTTTLLQRFLSQPPRLTAIIIVALVLSTGASAIYIQNSYKPAPKVTISAPTGTNLIPVVSTPHQSIQQSPTASSAAAPASAPAQGHSSPSEYTESQPTSKSICTSKRSALATIYTTGANSLEVRSLQTIQKLKADKADSMTIYNFWSSSSLSLGSEWNTYMINTTSVVTDAKGIMCLFEPPYATQISLPPLVTI